MSTYYIATGFDRKVEHNHVQRRLDEMGHEITYDWTVPVEYPDGIPWGEIGEAEWTAVQAADFVVVLLPGGRGTHVELGFALAAGCRIFICDPKAETVRPQHFGLDGYSATCPFYFVEGEDTTSHHTSVAGLIGQIREWSTP